MPYTPPSQRSPASSGPSSPATSRRGSFLPGQPVPSSPDSKRPELPRSASYLTRHRRTPSVKSASFVTNDGADSSLPMTDRERSTLQHNVNLRKSPPPVTDESKLPSGVILSPPESAQNSSDDEESGKPRGRQIEKLSELQAAIRTIAQHRASSPSDDDTETKHAGKSLSLVMPAQPDNLENIQGKPGQKLSPSAIKISHSRSNTDTTLYLNEMRQQQQQQKQQADTPITETDDDETDDSDGSLSRKPPMVRKKSGELVRPALRPSSRRRPSSMPGTPTFSKAVHFDSHLEHIRHFLQVDRPLAVSAGSSPVETYASDSEFPFSDEEGPNRSLPFEWEITLANFPAETYDRMQLPVRVERFYLSSDNKMLIGQVAVANLAFNKAVVARFTLDYWKTTSEVLAEYTNDVRRKLQNDGFDRFNFTIKLADLANLEAKTMFFCVKYCVNGVEYWDNNNSTNFQVDFRKKMKPMNGKKAPQGSSSKQSNGLPRSGNRPSPSRRTATTFEDDFVDGFEGPSTKYRFPYSAQSSNFGGSNGRLKGVRSEVALSTDSLGKKSSSPSGQAFSNRYDFGVSISAAIQAANSKSGDRPEIIQRPSQQRQPLKPVASPAAKSTPELASSRPVGAPLSHHTGSNSLRPNGAPQPPLASQSYNELLDKYCFFGSAKNSPPLKDGTLNSRPAQYDGTNDSNTGYVVESDTSSPDNDSPLMMQMVQRPALPSKSGSGTVQRSVSPAPMTGFVTAKLMLRQQSEDNRSTETVKVGLASCK
ncbi:hypothetical protein V492_07090 [Pseudogymnoascus sp. VKM F-4246]|nr:hypothetical protein V492_07090 [Pseudogymnoascus sp. VKM F-4246]